MATAIPVTFPNIAAIETMMAGLGDAKCQSIPIGRNDNYNHVIHRPRQAFFDPSTKTVVGVVCQHRTFSVNKPNGRIIWVFERASDNMLFLLKARKGPPAYDVWLNNQTFTSGNAWIRAHTFEKAESAAFKEKDRSILEKWLKANRPQDIGDSGEYLKHKAHVAGLPASSPTNNNGTSLPAASSSIKDKDTGTEVDSEKTGPSLPTVHQTGTSSKVNSKPASKKKPAKKTKEVAAPAPSSRQLRSKTTQKRKASDAELDDEETGGDHDEQNAPQEPVPTLVRPKKVAASSKPIAKPESKKLKRTPNVTGMSEKECENQGKELLSGWFSSAQQDNSEVMDLDGVDVVPLLGPFRGYDEEWKPHNKKTLIRYGVTAKDVFGGYHGLAGKAVTIEVAAPKRPKAPKAGKV